MQKKSRILIVDDNASILDDFRTILMFADEDSFIDPKIEELEAILFTDSPEGLPKRKKHHFTYPQYEIETASQGEDAVLMIQSAEQNNVQYDLIFMDIKMPPGMDGIETIGEVWKINPNIEVVICTAYTEYSWEDIIDKLGVSEHLLFLKKPINSIEIKQTALSLINKREADREKYSLRNYLKSIIDSMPSIIISVDESENILHWNIEAEQMTGIPPERAAHTNIFAAFPALTRQQEKIRSVIITQQPHKAEKVLWEHAQGSSFKDITIYPLLNNTTRGAVIRIDDVTNRIRLEEMMIQTDKMLSVGGLAAGMAHEINNPLTNILQSIQLINNRLAGNLEGNLKAAAECKTSLEAVRAYLQKRDIPSMLEIIRESGQRSAEIVKDMLSFSRKNGSEFSEVAIDELIDKTVEMASNDYMLKEKFDFKQINIIRQYTRGIPRILCEKNNIQLVLLNILKNGAQAMAGKTYSSFAPQFILRIKSQYDLLRIEIEDNGPGITREIKKRIFEPFFTTKDVGVGTGLGLSVSYFIITKNHNGMLSVESEPDQGCKFIIELPLQQNT